MNTIAIQPDLSALTPWQSLHDGRLTCMVEAAIAAGQHTLKHFRDASLQVDRKGDQSPVTIADREAEQLTRRLIAERFAEDTVAGEEFAETSGSSSYRWTVDPIDGTKSFISGVPLYSTLLALEFEDRPIGGAIIIPALGEAVVAASNAGCFRTQDYVDWKPARVSDQDDLSQSVFVTSEVGSFGERGDKDAFERLQSACRLTRTWGDGYGYLMVATGRADLMVDPICNAWDVAAMVPIMQESGGTFTDWKGTQTVRGGDGVGTNGKLHANVLAELQRR